MIPHCANGWSGESLDPEFLSEESLKRYGTHQDRTHSNRGSQFSEVFANLSDYEVADFSNVPERTVKRARAGKKIAARYFQKLRFMARLAVKYRYFETKKEMEDRKI